MARGLSPNRINWMEPNIYGDQPLAQQAAALHDQGLSYAAVAERLGATHDISVCGSTIAYAVRAWRKAHDGVPPMGGNPSSAEGGNGAPAAHLTLPAPLTLSPHTTRAEGELCEISLRIPGRIEFRAWGDSPDDLRRAMGEAETILGGVTG